LVAPLDLFGKAYFGRKLLMLKLLAIKCLAFCHALLMVVTLNVNHIVVLRGVAHRLHQHFLNDFVVVIRDDLTRSERPLYLIYFTIEVVKADND